MKKHNILKVVLISILLVVLCTWIFPITYFNAELVESAREQLGLFNLFSYPLVILGYFSHILFYVLLCGGLYGVLGKIPAYKTCLNKIVKGFEGKEPIFLTIVMVILAVLTSVVGFPFGLIVLFPMLISLVLMMGYNKLVAASVTAGSVICGLIGTTYATDTHNYLHTILATTSTMDIWFKVAILVLSLILLVFNVLRYAKKVKNKNSLAEKDLIPVTLDVPTGKKVRVWPFVLVFDLMLIVMLLGAFPWSTVFPEFTAFSDALLWVQEYELFGFPIFSKLLGDVQVFGQWSYALGSVAVATFPVVIIFAMLLVGVIYRVKFNEFLDGMVNGFKKAIGPAAIMMLIYMLLIISTYHPTQLIFTEALLGLTKGINVVTMSLVAFLSSFFNVEGLYVAQSTLPYVTSVITDTTLNPIIAVIFQSIYGLAMLVLPSSIIVMGTLSYLGVSYGKWLKHIWKLFVEILVVLLIIFIIMLAI